MKALVLTDHWKAKLSKGDYVTDKDYPKEVLLRADESGYLIAFEEIPTMDDTAEDIREYLKRNGISYKKSDTKKTLLAYVEKVEGSAGETDNGGSQQPGD